MRKKEKRNEVEIPLLVLAFWTAMKKFDPPVANTANQSGCMFKKALLFLVNFSRSLVETAFHLGNAFFKSSDKPVLSEALIFIIFWVPSKLWCCLFNTSKTICLNNR